MSLTVPKSKATLYDYLVLLNNLSL